MGNELLGRVALVTGASRGIGRAVAVALAEAGADVAVNYRDSEEQAQQVCEQITGLTRRCLALQADVSKSADVDRLVQTVQDQMGSLDILVNNAGIGPHRSVEEITERDWDELLAVNLKSVFLMTQAVLPGMRARRWGRIINVSSVAAHIGSIVGPHYAASKAGMLGLTHFYAALLAREGITVNAIAPALITTDMLGGLAAARAEMIPVGRFGTPEEVAQAAVLLARDAYITGQTLDVNGGVHMT